ncbi:MAG: rRNA maturation RNase YbeY [Patescibacteria group bacterium]
MAIKNLTRRRTASRAVFTAIAKEILPDWDISLVFIDTASARVLNKKLRGKNYVPNVLSYVVGEKSAEIIICPSEAAKQAPSFQLPASGFQLLLFIHALLHIKGWVHSANMDECERKLLSRFNETPNRNRNRYWHVPGKNGRSRGTF